MSGSWWSDGDGGGARVSVEQDYAERLGLKLGDTVTYDVAGEPVTATITSLREVRWDSFQPNFFMVFSPGVLEDVTGTLITSVHVQPAQRPALVDLVRQFPEVTIIDIDALLSQVRDVMDKAALAVQYVFLFTLAAGLMVLLAAVQATRDERRYESAMLRTLGASRRVVFQGVAAEFTALGLLGGPARRRRRDGRRLLPGARGVQPEVRARPVGVGVRRARRGAAGRHRRHARRTVGGDAAAGGDAQAGVENVPTSAGPSARRRPRSEPPRRRPSQRRGGCLRGSSSRRGPYRPS